MMASYQYKGQTVMLMMMTVGDMDKLLQNPQTSHVVGLPQYFDESERVWPINPEIKVTFV